MRHPRHWTDWLTGRRRRSYRAAKLLRMIRQADRIERKMTRLIDELPPGLQRLRGRFRIQRHLARI